MCCDGFISVPIVDEPVNAVVDVAQNVNDTITNALDNAGTSIDQTVREEIPGGWATVGAVAATVATAGALGAFSAGAVGAGTAAEGAGAVGAGTAAEGAGAVTAGEAGAGAVTAGEAGAGAGTLATDTGLGALTDAAVVPEATTAATDTGLGALTDTASSAIDIPSPLDATSPTIDMSPNTPVQNISPELDPTSQLAQNVYQQQIIDSALTGALKGAGTTVVKDVLTGQPITPEGLLTGAATGGVGGGVGSFASDLGAGAIGSGIAAGTAGGATGAAINGGNIGQGALSGALSGLSSGITGDALSGLDPVSTAAGQSVASTLTNALKTGNTNNLAENLIAGGLSSAGLTGLINGVSNLPTTTTDVASNGNLSNAELAAINTPYDTSQYPTYAPLASNGTDTPLVPLPPTVSIGDLTNNQSTPQGALSGTNGVENPDGTVTMPDGTVNTYDSNGELVSSTPPNTDTPTSNVDTTNINFVSQETPSTLSTVAQANQTAMSTAQATGDQALVDAVNGNNPNVIAALAAGDVTAAKSLTSSGGVTGGLPSIEQPIVPAQVETPAPTDTNTPDKGIVTPITVNSGTNGTTSTSVPNTTTNTTTNNMPKTAPKATLIKGTQIASPLASSYNIPIENYAPTPVNPQSLQEIQNAANGGIILMSEGGDLPMVPKLLKGQSTQHPNLMGWHGAQLFADGGMAYQDRTLPEGHNPKFFSEGGLNSMENRYVTGDGDGTSDSIPAMLANGEFVIPADIVSGLGNGSNDAGAEILNAFMETIREHKQKHDAKHLPPDSKSPLAYLKQAKQKASA